MQYVEIALGHARHQGVVIPLSQLKERMIHAQKNKLELYRSIFSYSEQAKDHIQSRKSMSGFIGEMQIDQLILDIDRGKNTDDMTLHRARLFVERLMDEWKLEDEIKPWFSGTGYHVMLPDIFGFRQMKDLDFTVKSTLDKHFPEADTSFYHKAGIIRVGYTINDKSHLYKIPLSVEELRSLKPKEIQGLAAKPRNEFRVKKETPLVFYPHLIITEKKTIERIDAIVSTPTKIVTCAQNIFNAGEEEGSRNIKIMRMTSAWRRAGVPVKAIVEAMKAYAPSMNPYDIERQVIRTYEKGYPYGCNDDVLKKFCSSTCIHYARKDYSPDIITNRDMERQFVKFARTDFTERAINLRDVWTLDEDFWLYPGYYVNLIGDTGLNKTALYQNLAVALRQYAPLLYMSTEFGNILLYRRFTQISHNMTKSEVHNYYQHNENHLSDAFNHIHYTKVTPNLNEISNMISRFMPKVVMIDTIDDIPVMQNGQYMQGLQKEDAIAIGLKQMAEKHECIIMGVHHIRKDGVESTNRDGDTIRKTLTLNASRGSGAFSQKADVVLGIEGNRSDNFRKVNVLKGRDDSPFRVAFRCDMNTFRFNQILPESIGIDTEEAA